MSEPGPPPTAEALLAHRAWVRSLARSLVADESRVDDVEQATWLAALERPPSHSRGLGEWLRRVVSSRAMDAHRSGTRRTTRERAAARPEAQPSAETLVERAEIVRDVVRNEPAPRLHRSRLHPMRLRRHGMRKVRSR